MRRPLLIGAGVLGYLAGIVGFYISLKSSGLSGIVQMALFSSIIAVSAVAVAYYSGLEIGRQRTAISFRNLGIVSASRRSDIDRVSPLSSRIQSATSDILFIGLSLPKLDTFTGVLEDKARNGVHVRLLVPDPLEKWLVVAIAKFLRREGPYPRELSWFFNNFLSVWKKKPNNFEVRVHSKMPTISASMFDGRVGNVELYLYGWGTDDRLILELDFADRAKDWKRNLDLLWNEATQLSSERMFLERIDASDRIAASLDNSLWKT